MALKISVVLIAQNNHEEIEFMIQSLLDQEPGPYILDVVLVDACSTDGDRTITKLRDSKIRLSYLGISVQILTTNLPKLDVSTHLFGAKLSSGDWVVFMTPGTFFHRKYLLNIVLTINTYYLNFDIVLSLYYIDRLDGVLYRQNIFDCSRYRNKELVYLREKGAKLTDFLGICLSKSIISKILTLDENAMWVDIFEKNYKVAYANVIAGHLLIGEKLDLRKRKMLFNQLFHEPSYGN